MNELQMNFYTLESLFDKNLWSRYFTVLECLLNAKLSHLDTNDPIRKKVTSLDAAADYVCSIGEQEGSRRLFGKFGKSKVEISITLFRNVSTFPNSVSLYFPEGIVEADAGRLLLYDAFLEGIKCFQPFYSLCDSSYFVARKRKSSGFAVDLQAELIGLFWLTFLDRNYVEFFGQSRFDELVCNKAALQNGIVIKLGVSPSLVDLTRENAESLLGRKSFVEPELDFEKPIGKNALTFKEILN